MANVHYDRNLLAFVDFLMNEVSFLEYDLTDIAAEPVAHLFVDRRSVEIN